MIQQFVDRFIAAKPVLREAIQKAWPKNYTELVKAVVEAITTEEYQPLSPDPERIHKIDDGDYQGMLIFVIGAKGYQPSDYWYVKVDYGSCSGCDSLEAARGYTENPTEEALDECMLLALHIVEGLKELP